MTDRDHRLRSVLLTVLVVAASIPAVSAGTVAAAPTGNATGGGTTTFHVEQGSRCYEVQPLGDGTESVETFYDYRNNETHPDQPQYWVYSSYGTADLQENKTSKLFVYNGTDGYSLVVVHDKFASDGGGATNGSTVTFALTGMENGTWAVKDDSYANGSQDDDWDVTGDVHEIDWKWGLNRTDGGAFLGVRDETITIDPGFNEDADAWGTWNASGDSEYRMDAWHLVDANGSEKTLDMGKNVTIDTGSCPDTTGPTAALSASSTTAIANDEAVTFDASGSTADGESGIAKYRWDFDGDGEVDLTSIDPTVSHTYSAAGEYDAAVTVVDDDENTDTATVPISVTNPDTEPPNAALSVSPSTADRNEPVTFDATESTDDRNVSEYRWDLDGDGSDERTTERGVVETSFDEAGEHEVSVTVVDGADNTAVATATVTISNDTAPVVESYQLQNPANKTIEVSFLGTESITDVEVGLTDENGTRVATLDETDFETSDAGTYVEFAATTTVESNGTYVGTLHRAADSDGDDAASGQRDATVVGPVEGDITYLNGSAVRIDGSFEQVDVHVSYYGTSGLATSYEPRFNVSGTTLITAGEEGVNGSMITLVEAHADTSTREPALEAEPPRFDYYAEAIEPEQVTVSVEGVTKVGDGTYDVTFAYDNPNDEQLTMRDSTFSANVAGEPPRTVEPGEHAFTVTWTPDSDDERATWTLNRSNFDQHAVAADTRPAHLIDGNDSDSAPPEAAIAVPKESPLDEPLFIDASDSTDDRGIVWYKYYVDGELLWAGNPEATPEDTTAQPWKQEQFPSGAGTYDVTVKVWDADGQADKATDTVTITAADGGDGEDGDGGDGEDGDGGDDSGDNSNDDPNEGIETDPNRGSRYDGIGTANPPNDGDDANEQGDGNDGGDENDAQQSDVSTVSERLADDDGQFGTVVARTDAPNADPGVEVSQTAPEGVEAPTPGVEGFEALSYLNVTDADRVTVGVSTDRLNATGATVEDLTLLGYENGSWTAVETTVTNATDDSYQVRANASDGVFAVGLDRAATDVTDLTVSSREVAPGESVTVTATVENTGRADGTHEATLSVGGDVVATRTVSVAAGETAAVTFDRTFGEAGVYEVRVGDASATVAVKSVETETSTTEERDEQTTVDADDGTETTTSDDESAEIPGFGVGVSLVALLAAALLALRRR